MPIDHERYPEIPQGARLQPTADPDAAYVVTDDPATGLRTPIGMIRNGVFIPTPQFSLLKAQAVLATKFAPESTPEVSSLEIPTAPAFSTQHVCSVDEKSAPASAGPAYDLPDLFGCADDAVVTAATSTAPAPGAVPVTAYLSAFFFSALSGGSTPADAAAFYRTHREFLASLSGAGKSSLPAVVSAEAFRRFLAVLNPKEISQYLQKELYTALAHHFGHQKADEPSVVFDATQCALTLLDVPVASDAAPLPSGFYYINAVVCAMLGAPSKKFFKSAVESGCDWITQLSAGEDTTSAVLVAAAEKALARAASERITFGTDRGLFAAVPGTTLTKTVQKMIPGLSSGILFTKTDSTKRTLFASSLPAAMPGLKHAAVVVNSRAQDKVTVFFPAAAAGNAAVILNLAVIAKIAKAVRKNAERRRSIAGLPALSATETNTFFANCADAAQSTAAFLTLV